MSNSTRVSAALHAELTEYASLLRALRTSHTLDLTNHLTKHANSRGASSDRGAVSTDIEPEDEVEQEASDSPRYLNSETHMATTPVAAPGLETDVSVSISDSRPGKGKKRMRPSETSDIWTRWPLLAGDVHIPEWELGEEVRLIAVQAMQHSSWATKADVSGNHDVDENIQMAGDQSGDELITDDVDSEALLTPAFLHILSTLTASHLKQILTLLTANTPRVEKSMQDRIAPADWQDVLRAAAGSGSISPEVLRRTQDRLEAVYGSSQTHLQKGEMHNRRSTVLKAKLKIDELMSHMNDTGEADVLSFSHPLSPEDQYTKRTKS